MRDFVADGSGLPDRSVGYAMLFNILHLDDPEALLREACRVLVPGGTLAAIHWRADVTPPRGPPPEIRPTAAACRGWAESAGLEFVRDESLLSMEEAISFITAAPGFQSLQSCGQSSHLARLSFVLQQQIVIDEFSQSLILSHASSRAYIRCQPSRDGHEHRPRVAGIQNKRRAH